MTESILQHNIKIIRLQNGEDIISDCIMDEQNEWVQLNNPMTIILKRSMKGTVMMMVPWLPLEVVSDNIATISLHDILTFADPKGDLIEYYGNMVEQANITAASQDKVLGQLKDELLDLRDDTLDELAPDPEDVRKLHTYLDEVAIQRKKKLH